MGYISFFFPEDVFFNTEMVNLGFKINLGSDIFKKKMQSG